MSKRRVKAESGYCDPRSLPRGPNGRCLCRQCGVEVKPPRITFCSNECVHEWKVRTNPGYVRQMVHRRDKGVCASCGVDCDAARRRLNELARAIQSLPRTPENIPSIAWMYARKDPPSPSHPLLVELIELSGRVGIRAQNRCMSLWQADHILPVVEGGGECGLDNYRTLCVGCHKRETAALAKRRAEARKAAPRTGSRQ
jgi:5-methylcytosine-specific restriction enzyme A